MAASEANLDPAAGWLYANDARLVTFFLGFAMVVLGAGILIMILLGPDGAESSDILLGIGIFIMLFAILLFLPRLRSRGAMSYSMVVERPIGVVEDAVRAAVEESGRKADVEVLEVRFTSPPRAVRVEGVTWRFSLQDASYQKGRRDDAPWTELVQTGLQDEGDAVARDLRERIASRLATPFATEA